MGSNVNHELVYSEVRSRKYLTSSGAKMQVDFAFAVTMEKGLQAPFGLDSEISEKSIIR